MTFPREGKFTSRHFLSQKMLGVISEEKGLFDKLISEETAQMH